MFRKRFKYQFLKYLKYYEKENFNNIYFNIFNFGLGTEFLIF